MDFVTSRISSAGHPKHSVEVCCQPDEAHGSSGFAGAGSLSITHNWALRCTYPSTIRAYWSMEGILIKVLVVVGSSGDSPYLDIENSGQVSTFGSEKIDGVELVWVQGSRRLARQPKYRFLNCLMRLFHRSLHSRFGIVLKLRRSLFRNSRGAPFPLALVRRLLVGSTLKVQVTQVGERRFELDFPNSYFLTPLRTLASFQFLLTNFSFDFILRTTSTCYVHQSALLATLNQFSPSGIYAGELLNFDGIDFVGGSSILASRDVVEKMVASWPHFSFDAYDDVALGKLVKIRNLASPIALDVVKVNAFASGDIAVSRSPDFTFLYSCKTAERTRESEPVVQLMATVHRALNSQPSP